MNATNYKRKAPSSTFTRNTSARNDAEAKITTYTTVKSGSSPTTLQINNVAIHFPFKPYDVQTNYMKCVLDALQRGEHALLESPTVSSLWLDWLCKPYVIHTNIFFNTSLTGYRQNTLPPLQHLGMATGTEGPQQ